MSCASSPAGTMPCAKACGKTLMHAQQPADRLPKGVHARFKPLEQEDAHQTAQVRPGPVQAGVWFSSSACPSRRSARGRIGRRSVLPGPARVGLVFRRFAQIAAQLLIEPLVGVFDAVLDGLQFASSGRTGACRPPSRRPCRCPSRYSWKLDRVNRLVRLGVEAIPTQDVVARPPDQDVGQQVRQFLFPLLDQLEILLQVRRVDGQVRLVVLVKELDLVVDVPCALVPGRGRQETAPPPGGEEVPARPCSAGCRGGGGCGSRRSGRSRGPCT